MRIVFIGCVKFSYAMLQQLLTLNKVDIVGIVTRQYSRFNADFYSLANVAHTLNIPCFFADFHNDDQLVNWLQEKQPDAIYCLGWSSLLKKPILEIPCLGVIGYHPAALPKNRGRHPIIWSLVLGLRETASTFFFMDEGIDSGDIIDQKMITITDQDDAASLYQKLVNIALKQISVITEKLIANTILRFPQDDTKTNYWRLRTKNDGLIDWRMSSGNIYNLIRGLTHPYVGAHCIYNAVEVKVWKSQKLSLVYREYENFEQGKVLALQARQIVVKTGDVAILLVEHEFTILPKVGEYL